MKGKFKVCCFIITIFMILSVMPSTALAVDETEIFVCDDGCVEHEGTVESVIDTAVEEVVPASIFCLLGHSKASRSFKLGGSYTLNKNDFCYYQQDVTQEYCTRSDCNWAEYTYIGPSVGVVHIMITQTNSSGQVIGYICRTCSISLI